MYVYVIEYVSVCLCTCVVCIICMHAFVTQDCTHMMCTVPIHPYCNHHHHLCMLPSFSLPPSPYLSPSHAAPPTVGVTSAETLLSVGDPLTLTCTGGDCAGTTSFTFTWLLDASPVDTSLVTVINSTTSQLSVTSVTSTDFGTYTCEMTSVYGTGTAVAFVRERGEFSHHFSHYGWELC